MVVAPAVHDDDGVSHPDTTGPAHPTASPRFRLVLAGVLALALVASLAWLTCCWSTGPTAARRRVRVTARPWCCAPRSGWAPTAPSTRRTSTTARCSPATATGSSRWSPPGSPATASTWSSTSRRPASWSRRPRSSTSTSVDRAGVESIDDDSAAVIISGIRESSVATQGTEQRPYQMLVDLQKIDGSWVVAKCNDVN